LPFFFAVRFPCRKAAWQQNPLGDHFHQAGNHRAKDNTKANTSKASRHFSDPLGSFEHSYPKKPKNHEYILSYTVKKVKQFSQSHHSAFAAMSQA